MLAQLQINFNIFQVLLPSFLVPGDFFLSVIYRSIHHLYEKQSHARTLPVVSLVRAFLNNLWTALNTIITTQPGTSANAGPHYQKLYARVTHIWGNRKGQPNRSAMRGPHLERTPSLITVPPASRKFFFCFEAGIQGGVQCQVTHFTHEKHRHKTTKLYDIRLYTTC